MRIRKWIRLGVQALLLWMLLAALLPFPDEKLEAYSGNLRFLDREGGLLRRRLAEGGEDRDWIPLSEAGKWAGPALIAVEDQRFYRHFGVDPIAVLRAVGQNMLHGRVVSGASTISTQVIRLTEPRPRNFFTKVIEAFRATQLEMRHDKAFILEQYLNRAPFGGNRIGLAAAARRYYGKEAAQLSSGEAALLMGLPQSPSRYSPERHPEKAEKRRETVLRRMREEGLLDQDPLLETGARWVEPPLRAFHFTEWLRRRHSWRGGELRTTLDPGMQMQVESVLARWRLDERFREADGVAVLLMDARSGEIRAWAGGWDARDPMLAQVDTVTRKRAPGSTLKPFAYALAMERGWLTPGTRLADLPRQYADYLPENMDERWSGEVSARDALVQSLNLPALGITERIGVPGFLGMLRSAGMELPGVTAERAGLGAVLGGGMEVSLLELVQAYSAFAGEGGRLAAQGLTDGDPQRTPLFSPGVAYWISRMLSGAERDNLLYAHFGEVARPDLAFKTGTSHGHRDAWAVGWNGEWVLGVWVGRMDGGRVNGLSGSTHAAPLLGELARHLWGEGGGRWPEAPDSVTEWRGREIIAGVTDPEEAGPAAEAFRIVSPGPKTRLMLLDPGDALLTLSAAGPGNDPAHWFVNGEWIGAWPISETRTRAFAPGDYRIRVVFADGSADTRQVQLMPPLAAGRDMAIEF